MGTPVAYFITFTTYGTWLHGRDSGSVDRDNNVPGTPFLPASPKHEISERNHLSQPEYRLDSEAQRDVVLRTILEVARHRGWKVWAIHVRTNHVHVIVTAEVDPEKVMSDLKAWASRRLREAFSEPADRHRWTQHGSTRYLWTQDVLAEKVAYVIDEQGEPMAYYDSRHESSEPEA